MSANVLALFWQLAELDETIRIKAAADLVRHLVAGQAAQPGLNEDFSYCLTRLVKGLASARLAARQGFGTALLELLVSFKFVTCVVVLDLLEKHVDLSGEGSSQRDAYFGKVFGLATLVQSGRLVTEEPHLIGPIVGKLAQYLKKKQYLNECCCSLLLALGSTLSKEQFHELFMPHINDIFTGETTPESLALGLLCAKYVDGKLKSAISTIDKSSLLSHSWKHIFGKEHAEELVAVLERTAINLPSLHCVWPALWDFVSQAHGVSFAHLWHLLVEKRECCCLRGSVCGCGCALELTTLCPMRESRARLDSSSTPQLQACSRNTLSSLWQICSARSTPRTSAKPLPFTCCSFSCPKSATSRCVGMIA
jgi:hypothetical protein